MSVIVMGEQTIKGWEKFFLPFGLDLRSCVKNLENRVTRLVFVYLL